MENYKDKIIALLGSKELSEEQKKKLEEIFPELIMSDNEEIKEEIKYILANIDFSRVSVNHTFSDMVNWLEKHTFAKTPQWMIDFLDEHLRHFGNPIDPHEHRDVYGKLLCIKEWLEGNYVEKKPADKVEPKFHEGDTMRTLEEAKEGITDGLPVVVSIDEEYYHCTNELISIKDQDDYEYPPMNRKQNPTWSEEDGLNLSAVIAKVQYDIDNGRIGRNRELLDWLKSLRPQKYVGYNPYKVTVESIAKMCNKYENLMWDETEAKDFLCEISTKCREAAEYEKKYPQKQWKPSDEQMASITCAVRKMKESACYDSELVSLLSDLKKLKGE